MLELHMVFAHFQATDVREQPVLQQEETVQRLHGLQLCVLNLSV